MFSIFVWLRFQVTALSSALSSSEMQLLKLSATCYSSRIELLASLTGLDTTTVHLCSNFGCKSTPTGCEEVQWPKHNRLQPLKPWMQWARRCLDMVNGLKVGLE